MDSGSCRGCLHVKGNGLGPQNTERQGFKFGVPIKVLLHVSTPGLLSSTPSELSREPRSEVAVSTVGTATAADIKDG